MGTTLKSPWLAVPQVKEHLKPDTTYIVCLYVHVYSLPVCLYVHVYSLPVCLYVHVYSLPVCLYVHVYSLPVCLYCTCVLTASVSVLYMCTHYQCVCTCVITASVSVHVYSLPVCLYCTCVLTASVSVLYMCTHCQCACTCVLTTCVSVHVSITCTLKKLHIIRFDCTQLSTLCNYICCVYCMYYFDNETVYSLYMCTHYQCVCTCVLTASSWIFSRWTLVQTGTKLPRYSMVVV